MEALKFLFRTPSWPLLVQTPLDTRVAASPEEFSDLVSSLPQPLPETVKLVDSTIEGWSYHPEFHVVSPLTVDKHYGKQALIDFAFPNGPPPHLSFSKSRLHNISRARLFDMLARELER